MTELLFVVLLLTTFVFPVKNSAVAGYGVANLWLQPMIANQTLLQDPELKEPSISIALESLKLSRQTPGVVELRIENTTQRELRLSEPSSFILEDSKLEPRKRSSEGFDASARLWDFLPKTSKQRENLVLQPGESFQCKIDLKELAWNHSKSSVYHYANDDPAGYLLNAVPSGRYTLYFELTNPPIVIRHTLTDRLFRSNELSVTLER